MSPGVASSGTHVLYKVVQRHLYSFLGTRWGASVCVVGFFVTLITGIQVIGHMVPGSPRASLRVVTDRLEACAGPSLSDNLAGRAVDGLVSPPIDVVYTWVNGSDPVLQRSLAEARAAELGRGIVWCEEGVPEQEQSDGCRSQVATANRFRDNNELRYSLRSLERYAPWVRHVYIVTNGQVPVWLDLSNPRVTIVPHHQLFANASSLPTFSSPAIESQLHRIPGLSETFLYLNDDVMFGAPVYPDHFFTASRGQRVFLSWSVPGCTEDCRTPWIGDGFCDPGCNVAACRFDAGDCEGIDTSSWSSAYPFRSGVDAGSPHARCATACPLSFLADGVCDTSCDVVECAFDGGDCPESYTKLHAAYPHVPVLPGSATGLVTLPAMRPDYVVFNLTATWLPETPRVESGSYDVVEGSAKDTEIVSHAAISGRNRLLIVQIGQVPCFNDTLLELSATGEKYAQTATWHMLIEGRTDADCINGTDDAWLYPSETTGGDMSTNVGDADGEALTKTDDEAPTKTDGEAPTKTDGEAPTKADGEAPTKTDGEAPTKADGEAPTKTDATDDTVKSYPEGYTSPKRMGRAGAGHDEVNKHAFMNDVISGGPKRVSTDAVGADHAAVLSDADLDAEMGIVHQSDLTDEQKAKLGDVRERLAAQDNFKDKIAEFNRWKKESRDMLDALKTESSSAETSELPVDAADSSSPATRGAAGEDNKVSSATTNDAKTSDKAATTSTNGELPRDRSGVRGYTDEQLAKMEKWDPAPLAGKQYRASDSAATAAAAPRTGQEAAWMRAEQERRRVQGQGSAEDGDGGGDDGDTVALLKKLAKQRGDPAAAASLVSGVVSALSSLMPSAMTSLPSLHPTGRSEQDLAVAAGAMASSSRLTIVPGDVDTDGTGVQAELRHRLKTLYHADDADASWPPAQLRQPAAAGQRRLLDMFGESLRHVDSLYTDRYGIEDRRVPAHMPHMIRRSVMYLLQSQYPEEFRRTAQQQFRAPTDMQYAFSYFYYLMSERRQFDLDLVFRLYDSNGDGTWDLSEVRTVAAQMVDSLGSDVRDTQDAVDALMTFVFGRHWRTLDRTQATMDLAMIEAAPAMLDALKAWQELLPRFKTELAQDQDEISFVMLHNNATVAQRRLDEVRRDARPFICLNDNLNYTDVAAAQRVQAILHEFYQAMLPIPSAFELPEDRLNAFYYLDQHQVAVIEQATNSLRSGVVVLGALAAATFLGQVIVAAGARHSYRRRSAASHLASV